MDKTRTDYQTIIDYFYGAENPELRHILMTHSRAVADKALCIVDHRPELAIDRAFVETAAMLHDIGIMRCDAPGIHCHGTRPYIQHGLAGAEMLRTWSEEHGAWDGEMERLARVCSHHTGAGITRQEIVSQGLPLPLADYLPETLEEQLVCYADKFFSKTHLEREKSVGQAEHSLAKFGADGVERFRRWVALFEPEKLR